MLKLSDLVSINELQPGLDSTQMLSAASIPVPADFTERIGRYKLIGLLGQGAFGRVWLADDEDLRRQVAIKVPMAQCFARDEDADAYLAEARALATLDHAHIVPVYDVGRTPEGSVYVVSKFIDGYTLAERIKENRPGQEEAISIVATMAEALAHAHERGLIHRDIKPANILLEEHTGRPYLADFGLAIREQDLNRSDPMSGTPAYMSPEQAGREGSAVDARSDLFSLGIVFYELLTGRRPFGGETLAEVLHQVICASPLPPRDLDSAIDPELQTLCLNALAKSPDDRPASAAAFAAALRAWERKRKDEALRPQTAPHNLPVTLGELVGRESEAAELQRLLGEARLVTLTGPGGVGKTRLALQTAWSALVDFAERVYFVQLAPVRDASLVASAIAQAVGCRESADRPLAESLVEFVAGRKMLLVLDNFEHVASAAELVSKLLAAATELRIVVTSRMPLRLAGEHEFPVSLLACPLTGEGNVDELSRYPAVVLFCKRARESLPDFVFSRQNAAAVVEICTRLDGLPLAIELAAARIKVLTPQAMLPRLQNSLKLLTGGRGGSSPRQQTLRGAIAWSYDLLTSQEQRLFRRLAFFVGGCTLAAIEATTPDDDDSVDALEGVASLVDKSILRPTDAPSGERRYGMLETVREFAFERLVESGEKDTECHRLASYMANLVEQAEPQLRGADSAAVFQQLEEEQANIRAAISCCLAVPDDPVRGELGLRIGGALWRFWCVRGYLREGRHWLTQLVAAFGKSHHDSLGAKARYAGGCLAEDLAEFAEAQSLYRESLALWEAAGEVERLPDAYVALGSISSSQGAYATARESFARALELAKQQGDRRLIAVALSNLGSVAWYEADYLAAETYHEEALTIRRELGGAAAIAVSLTSLGLVAARRGDLQKAETLYRESLVILREQQNPMGIAVCLNNLGEISCKLGRFDEARAMLAEAAALQLKAGDRLSLAYTIESLGALFGRTGNPAQGARTFAAAEALRQALGTPLPPAEEADRQKELDAIRVELGREEFGAQWLAGLATPLEAAVAEATKY